MPLNQRELTIELHRLQEKQNKTTEELKKEIALMKEYQDIKDKATNRERLEYLIGGIVMSGGIVLIKFFAPLLKGTWLSTNFNRNIGPLSVAIFLWGLWNIWKGVRR